MCGKIFCHSCCRSKLLLPAKYQQAHPQRVCELCSTLLWPLQPFLAGTQARAAKQPVHDTIDSVALRSWVNNPFSGELGADVYKVCNILQSFVNVGRLSPEASIPPAILQGAKGLAVLSVLRVGAGWSGTYGTGLVLSRTADGAGWSAPCSIACYGLGWGLQLGTELTDLLLVLRTDEALQAFCGSVHLAVGGNLGVAVGPVGRAAEAALHLPPSSLGSATPVYSYSCSKGAFIGVSVEGSLMCVRAGVNQNFYGERVTPDINQGMRWGRPVGRVVFRASGLPVFD